MSSVIPDPAVTDWVPLGYGAAIQSNVPTCRVYRAGSAPIIATSTLSPIPFDGERWDTDNIHDVVTNPSRMVCRTAGKYLVTASAALPPNATGQRQLSVLVNANYVAVQNQPVVNAVAQVYMTISTIVDLVVGDYVEIALWQDSGVSLTMLIGSGYAPEAEIAFLGPGLLGRGVQNITGTYLTRPAANAVPPGSTYFAYDSLGTWLSDGSQWFLIAQRPAFGAGSILGQAPWSTPYDGMEVLITDSFANPAFTWHFRYNSGSSSAYKWECLGGAPYVNYSAAQQVVNVVSTWQNIVASAITPPRGGEYICQAAVQASHPLAGTTAYVALWSGSVPAGVFGPTMAFGWPVAGGYSGQFTIGPYKATLSAGVGIGIAAQNNQAGGAFSVIQYSLMPTRIS